MSGEKKHFPIFLSLKKIPPKNMIRRITVESEEKTGHFSFYLILFPYFFQESKGIRQWPIN